MNTCTCEGRAIYVVCSLLILVFFALVLASINFCLFLDPEEENDENFRKPMYNLDAGRGIEQGVPNGVSLSSEA